MGKSPETPDTANAHQARQPNWASCAIPSVQGTALFEWDVVQGTVWYSDEWRRMTQSDNYDWTRPNNQAWWNVRIHPEDFGVLERASLAILARFAESSDAVFRLKRGDGSWRWLLARAQVSERSPDGAPLRVSGVCLDLTDIYSTFDAPKSSSSVSDFNYHSMFENSPDLYIRLDRDFSPVYVNPVVDKYIGRTDHALADTLSTINISGEYKKVLRENIEQVFCEKTAVRKSLSFTMPDGAEISGECSFWPEFDDTGNVQYVMVQFRDLTEKRKMEQRLILNEQRLSALYKLSCMENASEDEVLDFVMASVLKLTNSRSGFIFFPEDEHLEKGHMFWSRDHYDFFDKKFLPDDSIPHEIRRQIMQPDDGSLYRGVNNGDGDTPLYVVFDQRMSVMRGIVAPGMEGNRIVCIAGLCNKATDYEESDLQQVETFINGAWLILRRRRFVRELQEAKEAAEIANKAKNVFLANVSHELRTPLNGVLSMLQLINSMSMGEQQREYLKTAQSSGKALLRIISDLLDFSCMESEKMPLTIQLFDCKATLRSALRLFEETAAQKGLRFSYRISPAIPDALLGDESRICQIIFNIVGNALKFTSEGGVNVLCEVLPEPPPGKAGINITVKDSGIGIPSDKLSSIFDAFTQIESSNRNGKYPGTGLGLGIVKHLVSRMNGTITVESTLGQGTVFQCSLFLDLPSDAHCAEHNAQQMAQTEPVLQSMDILVAEDDQVSSFAMRSFLERDGHRVVCVVDGKQALEALQLHDFHCIFTDIAMPQMDGIELAQRIRTNFAQEFPPSAAVTEQIRNIFPQSPGQRRPIRRDIPIVAVTAHTMIGDKEKLLAQGINHYLAKPIIHEDLRAILKKLSSE